MTCLLLLLGLDNMDDDIGYSGKEIYNPRSNTATRDPLDLECTKIIHVNAGRRVRLTFLTFDVDMDPYSLKWYVGKYIFIKPKFLNVQFTRYTILPYIHSTLIFATNVIFKRR